MDSNHNDARPRALFLADSHFHVERTAGEEVRFARFVALLDRHAGVPDVVLMGDIFDFWFDYPHFVMKGYDNLLDALDRVRAAGSRLHFVGGNHDIWAAGYFHRRYGTAPGAGPVTLDLDGRRVRCIHGDGLLGRDLLYRLFRSIVRHPAGIMLGKSLHPELLYAFSTWLSGTSRHSTRDEVEGIETKARRWLTRRRDADWDHLVMGHVHHPFTAEHGGRRLSTLGGWLDPLCYATWEDGELRHRQEPATPTSGRSSGVGS
jgi:UDP-2,3-diacylglucosamine hydrolase